MIVNTVQTAEQAMRAGLRMLLDYGVRRPSRNGEVLVAPDVVATVTRDPRRCVVLNQARDANPFFHLMEALWMLAGRNDVTLPGSYVKRMYDYSSDGATLHGAYGHRWRVAFGMDQLTWIVAALKNNHDDRRQVLQMWDAALDLQNQAARKDLPCNLTATFQVSTAGALDMVVFQRSGDALWGVHGANAVHMALLLQYVAERVELPVGTLTQVTHNYHLYRSMEAQARRILDEDPPEARPEQWPFYVPLGAGYYASWEEECGWLLAGVRNWDLTVPFLRRVACRMRDAYQLHKDGNTSSALVLVNEMPACDWKTACTEWLQRRLDKQTNRKEDSK